MPVFYRVIPQHKILQYTWVGSGIVRVNCHAQELITMSLSRALASDLSIYFNHEATEPSWKGWKSTLMLSVLINDMCHWCNFIASIDAINQNLIRNKIMQPVAARENASETIHDWLWIAVWLVEKSALIWLFKLVSTQWWCGGDPLPENAQISQESAKTDNSRSGDVKVSYRAKTRKIFYHITRTQCLSFWDWQLSSMAALTKEYKGQGNCFGIYQGKRACKPVVQREHKKYHSGITCTLILTHKTTFPWACWSN